MKKLIEIKILNTFCSIESVYGQLRDSFCNICLTCFREKTTGKGENLVIIFSHKIVKGGMVGSVFYKESQKANLSSKDCLVVKLPETQTEEETINMFTKKFNNKFHEKFGFPCK